MGDKSETDALAAAILPDEEGPDAARVSRLDDAGVEPGVWRYAMAEKASVVIDAEGYFAQMQEAMSKARHRIMLVGWDFDTRIHLAHGRRWYDKGRSKQPPKRLGAFIPWLTRHRKSLEIRLLKWSFGIFKFPMRGTMWFDLLRWSPHRRIDFKFDGAHPIGCSHHQKIVTIDAKLAVCGGIDMTSGRWDTREHLENDENRTGPGGDPYTPWHDATMMMEGEVAMALDDLGRDRWIRAGGKPLVPVRPPDESRWPSDLEVQFENVEIGIARSRAKHRDWAKVDEVETLFLKHIRRAKRFIYAESQYFAARSIAEAIAERMEEKDPPEIVIVHPRNADGWLEQQAMDHARAELVECIEGLDHRKRFSIWSPLAGETPIYVHAKIMIVDDEIIRIGSANLNNRSLGLDSECDVFIDARRPANRHAGDTIRAIRHSLLAEHLGLDEGEIGGLLEEYGSMRALIEADMGNSPRRLERYRPPDLNDMQETLAESQLLDPEEPEDMFEPFARGGLFRKGGRLYRMRQRIRRKLKR